MKKILIIDDEEYIAKILSKLAYLKGIESEIAFSGKQANFLLINNKYDIVFIDIHLKDTVGEKILTYIHDNGIITKTVIMSGMEESDCSFYHVLKYDAYLYKPELNKKFYEIIDTLS